MNRKTYFPIAVIIGFLAIGFFIALAWQEQKFSTLELVPMPERQVAEGDNALFDEEVEAWEIYTNSDLNITFSYPRSWGNVIIEDDNLTTINTPPCSKPPIPLFPRGTFYPWELYTTKITFSLAPSDVKIVLLNLSNSRIPRQICTSDGTALTLSNIHPNRKGDPAIIGNSNIKFSVDSTSPSTVIGTNVDGPAYSAYHNNVLVWIQASFAPHTGFPEVSELQKYTCSGSDYYNTDKGCGIIAWFENGVTSREIRKSFTDLEELVRSFTFL